MTKLAGWAVIGMQAFGATPVLDIAEASVTIAVVAARTALAGGHGWRAIEPAVSALVTRKIGVLIAASARLCRGRSAEAVDAAEAAAAARSPGTRILITAAAVAAHVVRCARADAGTTCGGAATARAGLVEL